VRFIDFWNHPDTMASSTVRCNFESGVIFISPAALFDQMSVRLVRWSAASILRRSIGLAFPVSQLVLTLMPIGVLLDQRAARHEEARASLVAGV
jgi:hypothetical protein